MDYNFFKTGLKSASRSSLSAEMKPMLPMKTMNKLTAQYALENIMSLICWYRSRRIWSFKNRQDKH